MAMQCERRQHSQEDFVNAALAGLGMALLGATPALSAGFEQVTMPDPAGPPLEAGIWYPSEAPAVPQRLGLFEQTVAADGAIAGRDLPLVVMSHGSGGSFEGHYDTALALAAASWARQKRDSRAYVDAIKH